MKFINEVAVEEKHLFRYWEVLQETTSCIENAMITYDAGYAMYVIKKQNSIRHDAHQPAIEAAKRIDAAYEAAGLPLPFDGQYRGDLITYSSPQGV